MKRVVIAGGSGFIGRHLVRAFRERGDDVTVLSRRAPTTELEGVHVVEYDPYHAGGWYEALAAKDAVIQLAGEQVVGVRLSEKQKQRVTNSRVATTEQLVRAVAAAKPRPSVFVCASGINYYGARPPAEVVDETSAAGTGFLPELCQKWEARARQAEALGVRVVLTRFGVTLASDGGALKELVKPFKFFVGGPIGSGEQILSWIHVDDLVAAVLHCLEDQTISGPVNVTAPHAVSYGELARTIGDVLGRPSWFRVPATALRLRFGEGAKHLLTGQRVVPAVLKEKGFVWRHPELESALRSALSSG